MGELTLSQLLLLGNSILLVIAGFFLREFVRDMKKLTATVINLRLNVALLAQHVQYDIRNFSEIDA